MDLTASDTVDTIEVEIPLTTDCGGHRRLAIAVILRALSDLRSEEHRDDALGFFASKVCDFWCSVAGLSRQTVDRKVHASN